jgi:hypothetical protein
MQIALSNVQHMNKYIGACSLGTDVIKDLQNQRDLSSVLPSVPTLSRHLSHPLYNIQHPKYVAYAYESTCWHLYMYLIFTVVGLYFVHILASIIII